RGGDNQPQDERVTGGAARADEIGGDHRLAVAGLQRVEGAEDDGAQQRDGDDPGARLPPGHEVGERGGGGRLAVRLQVERRRRRRGGRGGRRRAGERHARLEVLRRAV